MHGAQLIWFLDLTQLFFAFDVVCSGPERSPHSQRGMAKNGRGAFDIVHEAAAAGEA